MADTARTKEEEKEYFDSEKELDAKVTKLAKLIQKSKHFVAFTGINIVFTIFKFPPLIQIKHKRRWHIH